MDRWRPKRGHVVGLLVAEPQTPQFRSRERRSVDGWLAAGFLIFLVFLLITGGKAYYPALGTRVVERFRGRPSGQAASDRLGSGSWLLAWMMRSAARSAIMTVGAWVWPRMIRGITEASTTRNPSRPRTRSSQSTTAASSLPMRQVPTGWNAVWACSRMNVASVASSTLPGQGAMGAPMYGRSAAVSHSRSAMRRPATRPRRSDSAVR